MAILLYAWQNIFPEDSVSITMAIPTPIAIASVVLVLIGGLSYGRTPEQHIKNSSIAIYILTILLFIGLVVNSSGLASPLLVLWAIIAAFAGIFGWWGIGGMLILAVGFLAYNGLTSPLTRIDIINGLLTLDLPILLSYMLWHGNGALFANNPTQDTKLSKSLKSESEKSSTIIRSISDGVIMTKASGEITLINPAAQKMTGWSVADAIQLHINSVLKLEDKAGNIVADNTHPASQALANKKPSRQDVTIITKSEKRITATLAITPTDNGGIIVVFRDVTKERAEEREQAEFISTASHEMRTPVASIEGFLGLALNPKTATIDEKARGFISKAHESAQYLGRLLRDLLEISRAEDGRLKHNIITVEAIEMGKKITESLTTKAQEKGLNLIYKPNIGRTKTSNATISPMLYIRADKDHLQEALTNLIENAIKYTPSGQVTVDVTADSDQVRFSVTDTGIGIPPEDLPHLFQKFYRVDNSDTQEIGGTGLGLYLTRKLIESMNGKIGAESKRHKGSTFYIDMPRVSNAQATAMIEEANRQAQAQARKAKIIEEQSEAYHPESEPISQPEAEPIPQSSPELEIEVAPQPQQKQQQDLPPKVEAKPEPDIKLKSQPAPTPNLTPPPPPKLPLPPAPPIQTYQPITQPNYTQNTQTSLTPPVPTPAKPKVTQNPAATPNTQPQPTYRPNQYRQSKIPPKPIQNLLITNRTNTPISNIERDPTIYLTKRKPPTR